MTSRPFYHEFAWAYDLLIDRPVRAECDVITSWLEEHRVYPGSTLLDAGCGTGRYAVEMARRGFAVQGIDASPDMLRVAETAKDGAVEHLHFQCGDIDSLRGAQYDAVLCRGVLNDPHPATRRHLINVIAHSMRAGGVLVVDVREWDQTLARKQAEPLFRKRVHTAHGLLTFTSITALDEVNRRLVISENHTLERDGHQHSVDNDFEMYCWTREELADVLRAAGFVALRLFGAYDASVEPGTTDRLVVVGIARNERARVD